MSKTGELTRGLKFWMQRDIDGNLPSGIAENPDKMADVNAYLAHIKGKNADEIKKEESKLFMLRHLQRSPRRKSNKVERMKEAILTGKNAPKDIVSEIEAEEEEAIKTKGKAGKK